MTGPETDLERIEAALADGRASAADPRERELQELALALRADSAEPAPAFAAELDRRVAAGFPKKRRGRGRLALPSFWIPALGAAALVVVALVVALSSGGGGSAGPQVSSAGDAGAGPGTDALAGPSVDPAGPKLAAPSRGTLAVGGRHVERSVDLTITTAHDRLQQAADGVGTIAESHGGFVLTSHVDTGDQGSGGSFTLRVPQRQLQATVADISKLGHLKARSESGQDMTAPYNDVQDKLGNALLERRALKLKLRHARGTKADAIRLRLETLDAAISSLNGRMRDLRQRTVYSTVTVTLEQARGSAGGTGAAWDDARHTLEGMLNFALRALAVLLPLALLGALAALGGRSLRRRRREAPLL